MKSYLPLLPFIILICIVLFFWQGLKQQPSLVPSPLINHAVPIYVLPTLDNVHFTQSPNDFLGKITLVNIWATWCYACAEEHPLLMQIAHSPDYVIYGYSYKDNPTDVKQWLATHGNPFDRTAIDSTGQTAIDWGVYGTPETFIVDKKGQVRYKLIGPITEENWHQVLYPFIQQLRQEP